MENSAEFLNFEEPADADIPVPDTSSINSDANTSLGSINSDFSASFTDSTNKRQFSSQVWDFFERVEWNSGRIKKTARCIIKGCKHAPFSCGYDDTTRPLW
jgi:hypothetical protein